MSRLRIRLRPCGKQDALVGDSTNGKDEAQARHLEGLAPEGSRLTPGTTGAGQSLVVTRGVWRAREPDAVHEKEQLQ
jgi:hypothetical protein